MLYLVPIKIVMFGIKTHAKEGDEMHLYHL